jgi:hypothetical protein
VGGIVSYRRGRLPHGDLLDLDDRGIENRTVPRRFLRDEFERWRLEGEL